MIIFIKTILKLIVHFAKQETSIKFEQEIKMLTENKTTMGIEEFVLDRAEKKGLEKGKIEFVEYLLLQTDFDVKKIALLTNFDEAFVIKVKKNLR